MRQGTERSGGFGQIIPPPKAVTNNDYKELLRELKSILPKGQFKAYKAVDNIKVRTYWQLGERIVREELKHGARADYGKYLIDNLFIEFTQFCAVFDRTIGLDSLNLFNRD